MIDGKPGEMQVKTLIKSIDEVSWSSLLKNLSLTVAII